ncbi:MAG: energy-coupling factor ABC transporter ATP-binding protein [Bacillaceae bacterium]|nr:energy-coupling factor ABC transporter ATP-binding protein [Bacillaceae bacterium]
MQIKLDNIEHTYQIKTPYERKAIYDINLTIPPNSYTAIIGHTGSGKSTLLQHLNALLQPTKGAIHVGEHVIRADKKSKNLKALRKKVGVVFQFPEHQLFEETVEKDICFGPINFGVSEEVARARAKEAIKLVGLDKNYLSKSPFDLSGGQMRRVAIAGVLSMDPDVLVLDEPTAGLDPRGRKEIMDLFYRLHKERNMSTILVTHSMEDAATYADRIIVMSKGTVVLDGTPRSIFNEYDQLKALGLDVPDTVKFVKELEKKLGKMYGEPCLSIEEVAKATESLLKGDHRHE